MFSPSAENLAMPGRLPAAPRSRWAKSPVLAMWADQSAAIRARSSSQASSARPRARRSALRRANRSRVSRPATDWPPGPGAAVLAGVVVVGAREVVVAGRVVVVGELVVGRAVLPGARPAGTWANTSATQTQPPGAAPTPRALKERSSRLARRAGERSSSWCACSTLAAQTTLAAQEEAGCTALPRLAMVVTRCWLAMRVAWAPATADRRGRTASGARPGRARSALTRVATRTASGAGRAAAARSRWPKAPGLALAGTSTQASASGSTIRAVMRRFAGQAPPRPWRAWRPPVAVLDQGSLWYRPVRTLAVSPGWGPDRHQHHMPGRDPGHAVCVPLARWGDRGGRGPPPPPGARGGRRGGPPPSAPPRSRSRAARPRLRPAGCWRRPG